MLRFLLRRPPVHLRRPPLLLPFLSSSSSSSSVKSALVVDTLRRHGIPDDLCSSLVARFRRILTLKPDENLAPKLAFLRSEGFSGHEVAAILLRNPYLLLRSLERFLAPSVSNLKSCYQRNEVIDRIICNRWFSPCRMVDNLNLLRNRGVPEVMIYKLYKSHSQSFWCHQLDFLSTVDFIIDELHIRPTAAAFATALRALYRKSRLAIQRKVRLYKKLGWADEEVLRVFSLQPTVMRLSDGVVRKKVGYLRDRLDPRFLRRYPEIMTMSVEKRIAPRCAVLDLLMSKGLIRRTTQPANELKVSDARFIEEFVEKHKEAAPDVTRAYYAREAEFRGWSWLKEDAEKNHQPPKKLAS